MQITYNDLWLAHHGIRGQKWGIRRFQNEDGSLKPAGEGRYYDPKSDGKRPSTKARVKENRQENEKTKTPMSSKKKAAIIAGVGAAVAAAAAIGIGVAAKRNRDHQAAIEKALKDRALQETFDKTVKSLQNSGAQSFKVWIENGQVLSSYKKLL